MNPVEKILSKRQQLDARLIQARISKPIYDKLRAKLHKKNVTIQAFIEAAALIYLEDK